MDFLKQNSKIILIYTPLILLSVVIEVTFRGGFPFFSAGLLFYSSIILLISLVYLRLLAKTNRNFYMFKRNYEEQNKINRNLMFAIEELLDLQRENLRKESDHTKTFNQ